MAYSEQDLGERAVFLLPSLKLKGRGKSGALVEQQVHEFLLGTFGGYTAAAGNIFGYWKDRGGSDSYGEHRQFTVGLNAASQGETLKNFLAGIAGDLGEESIYIEIGGRAVLIYG
jgi:hypothetical protein